MPLLRALTLLVLLLSALPTLPALAQDGPDFLIESEWLEEHIDDENLVILEVRYYPHRYFTIGHIPGAVQVARFMDLGDNAGQGTLMKFPPREQFQATLRRWGVNDDSTIVIYDDSASALARPPAMSPSRKPTRRCSSSGPTFTATWWPGETPESC